MGGTAMTAGTIKQQGFYSPTVLAEEIPSYWPTFHYTSRHIPSGKTWETGVVRTPSRTVFLELLAHWSKSSPDVWQYWERRP